jgi:hypothetical protein
MSTELEELKYPIGKFKWPETVTTTEIDLAYNTITSFPEMMMKAVSGLSAEQLDTPYRQEGWTIRQVVHHCADSHMNALIRFKLALTEDGPTIKPYKEGEWAKLVDYTMDPTVSIYIITGVHARWTALLDRIEGDEWQRTFVHPEHGRVFRLDQAAMLYQWHCLHHLSHILKLRERKDWI